MNSFPGIGNESRKSAVKIVRIFDVRIQTQVLFKAHDLDFNIKVFLSVIMYLFNLYALLWLKSPRTCCSTVQYKYF
jgi:hypothetical protein